MIASLKSLLIRIRQIKQTNQTVLTQNKNKVDDSINGIYKKINDGQKFMSLLNKEMNTSTLTTDPLSNQKKAASSSNENIKKVNNNIISNSSSGLENRKLKEQSLSQQMLNQVLKSTVQLNNSGSSSVLQNILQKHLKNKIID